MNSCESTYDPSKINKYWESLGKSACPDNIVRDMSIDQISRYLPDKSKVLDLGCGNGYCTFQFAKTQIDSILGIDYSHESIKQAEQAAQLYDKNIQRKIQFQQGDVLSLNLEDSTFDIGISLRCLINVGNIDNQQKALSEIHRILKPGGVYLMCENFLTGLESINDARGRVGLDEIKTRWHNNYIDDKLFKAHIKTKFELIEEDHFASTYYLLTRVVKAWICKGNGEEPEYDDDFNKMSSKLSAVGKFSPMRLYLLKKLE